MLVMLTHVYAKLKYIGYARTYLMAILAPKIHCDMAELLYSEQVAVVA